MNERSTCGIGRQTFFSFLSYRDVFGILLKTHVRPDCYTFNKSIYCLRRPALVVGMHWDPGLVQAGTRVELALASFECWSVSPPTFRSLGDDGAGSGSTICRDTALLRSFSSTGSDSALSIVRFCMSSFIDARSLSPVSCSHEGPGSKSISRKSISGLDLPLLGCPATAWSSSTPGLIGGLALIGSSASLLPLYVYMQ